MSTRPPGLIALFGSGETSPAGRRVHEYLFERLGRPIDVAVLGTPAGFETNAERVAERLRHFLETSLQNFVPTVALVVARRNDEQGGTNDAVALAPLLQANYLLFGPGSPSYAVRHLRDSVALSHMELRWQAGATLAAASAAAIALGRWALPVYEIFKAGHDPAWIDGLDLLGAIGLRCAVVPHWNNAEGGKEFDSSRCFLGLERFERLRGQLDSDATIIGLDEATALVVDPAERSAVVMGLGSLTVLRGATEAVVPAGEKVALALLGA